ncbi:MAG TPA: LysR family transcriptional regulator [Candidatus Baltobacteraceae bacterium]|nr:LysR family transcriptional regulator [Candidatus Baltobacteraceae bacterium]
MEFRQLRSVVAVARHGSFTKGAEALAVAQPALSQQIASLERELGVRLFDRTNRRVVLTEAGRAFSARAERILADADAAAEEMTAHAGGLRGRVVLGTYQSFAEYTLPKLLGRFHATYPGIEVALREGMADDLLAGLRDGHIDVFVGQLDEATFPRKRDFHDDPLYEDELVIAVAGSHPLASRSSVRIEDLRDEAFVIFRPGSSITHRLNALARAAGFEPRVAFESVDSLTVRSLVAEGLGVALYPRMLGNTPGPYVALLSLSPQRVMRRMSLVTRTTAYGPSAQLFITFIREALVEW